MISEERQALAKYLQMPPRTRFQVRDGGSWRWPLGCDDGTCAERWIGLGGRGRPTSSSGMALVVQARSKDVLQRARRGAIGRVGGALRCTRQGHMQAI